MNVIEYSDAIWTAVFFLLSVSVTGYTLSRKKINIIFGAFGSISGHNFYMGTQNGSKLEVLSV